MYTCFIILLCLVTIINPHKAVELDVLFSQFNGATPDFETIKPRKTSKDLSVFAFSYVTKDRRSVYGHRAIIRDPSSMFTIALPKEGCAENRLDTITRLSKLHGCEVAVNAGFFEQSTGRCYGNIINNDISVYLRESKMPVFGLRKDGSLAVGYHVENNKNNRFVQLISGIGWLVRRNNVYVQQSLKKESCGDSAALENVFLSKSARTLLGYDENGCIHLIQTDGRTHEYGATLEDAATFAQQLNLVNVINLDGGGSSAFVVNDTLVNYPANVCTDNDGQQFLCEKNISSIICIRGPRERVSPESLMECCRTSYRAVIALSIVTGLLAIIAMLAAKTCMQYRWRYRNLTQPVHTEEHLQDYLEKFASPRRSHGNGDLIATYDVPIQDTPS